MTAATIRSAAELVNELDLSAMQVVNLVEIGSEGSMFYIGPNIRRRAQWLITREGARIARNTYAEKIEARMGI